MRQLQDLDRLLKLAEDDTKLLVQCCRLRSDLGDHVKAIDGLTNVLNDSPDHHLASLSRGGLLSRDQELCDGDQ